MRVCQRFCLLLPALLLLASPAWAKLPKGVTLSVNCGYDGIVQQGRVNPITVDLENNNPKLNIDGELLLDYEGVEYATKLQLPNPSKKRYVLYFPCNNYSPAITLRIRSKAYTDEFLLAEPKSFKTVEAQDVHVLVLSKQPGSLGVLNQQSAARLYRDIYGSTNSQLGAGHVAVSYANLEEVDPTPKYFACADVIVIGDIDYQQVSAELAEALKAAVAGGTSLVFSLGLNGSGVSASPLAAICPLATSGTAQVSELGAFGRRYGFAALRSPAVFAIGRLQRGAEVLAQAGQYPAVVQMQWGSGTATALAFDYSQAPFKQNAKLAAVLRDAVLSVGNNIKVTNWLMHPDPVRKILERLAQAKPIPPGFVALYLLAYVLLIGPLNFLVLDRLKKRTFVWTSIPLLVIGFTYAGLNTGYLYRGRQNICAFVQEIHVYPGAAYAPYQTVMLVFSAEGGSYKLEVPDKSAFVYPRIPQPSPDAMFGLGPSTLDSSFAGKIDSSGEPLVTSIQSKWSGKNYFYQGYLDLKAKVTCDLAATRSSDALTSMRGDFSLDLPFDLLDCRLYTPEMHSDLGNLRGKGTYSLPTPSSNLQASLPATDYLVQARHELAILQQNASRSGLLYRDEMLLIGYTDQLPALAKLNTRHKQYALSMVVVHLPYRATISTAGPAEVSRVLLAGGSGFALRHEYDYGGYMAENPDLASNYYQLQKDSYVSFSYELAGTIAPDTKLLVHLEVSDQNSYQPLPDVENYIQAEAWSSSGWQKLRIPPGDQSLYIPTAGLLDAQNRITLRYRALKEVTLQKPAAEAY